MKKVYLLIFAIVSCICFSSCAPQIIKVQGTPGYYISDQPTLEKGSLLGIVGSNGTTTIEMDKQNYYPCLFSINPKNHKAIPFALDFTTNPAHYGWSGLMGVAGAGVGGLFASLVAVLVQHGDPDPSILGLTMTSLAVSFGGMVPGISIQEKGDYGVVRNYKYLPTQNTNDDLAR